MSSEPAEVFHSKDWIAALYSPHSLTSGWASEPYLQNGMPLHFFQEESTRVWAQEILPTAMMLRVHLGDRHGEGDPSVTCLHLQLCGWGPRIHFWEQPQLLSARTSPTIWVILWASLSLVFNLSNACHIQFTLAIRQKRQWFWKHFTLSHTIKMSGPQHMNLQR